MIRSIILESVRPGMNPESNLISCMISENGPNFSGPHFFVSKVEPRQLPTKGELNEKRHAQFLAQHQPHSDRQWFTAVANTDAKTLNILHVQPATPQGLEVSMEVSLHKELQFNQFWLT